MGFLVAFSCFCVAIACVTADPIPVEKTESDLRHALLEHYDHSVRPIKHVKDAVPVSAALVPVAIRDVDEKHQTIKMDTWFIMRWEDDYMHWDPSEYGGLDSLRLPSSDVWTPDLAVYYSDGDSHHMPSVHTNVVVFPNGTVFWVPPFTVQSRCVPPAHEEDKEHFHCTVQIGSWTYDETKLSLHEYRSDVKEFSKEYFQDTHPDWSVDSMTSTIESKTYSCCPEAYPALKLLIVLKKKHDDHHDKKDHHDDHHDGHKDDHHDGHKDDHHDDHKDDHHDDHKDDHHDEVPHTDDNSITPAGEH